MQYGNFLKSATLLADGGKEKEIENHVTTETIEIKPFQALNDEELFKACDGRTAHKGARHGLNLSGKLQRIAEQEKFLMERLKKNKEEVFKQPENSSPLKTTKKRPLIELNTSKDESSEEELPLNLESESTAASKAERKKFKKSHMKKLNKIASKIDSIELESPSKSIGDVEPIVESTLQKRRKEKKLKKCELQEIVESSEAESIVKKKFKTLLDEDNQMGEGDMNLRKKKKKRKNEEKESKQVLSSSPEKLPNTQNVHVDTPMRKKKKKTRKDIAGMEKISEGRESYKRLIEDDIAMSDNQDVPVKSKKIKLHDPYEATGDDDESDIVDTINSEHFQNMPFKNKTCEVEHINFESSLKKDKKSKKKDKGFSTVDWEVKHKKKTEKIEKQKRKKLKNMERKELKREKRNLKKIAKKELATKTELLANKIDSLEFK